MLALPAAETSGITHVTHAEARLLGAGANAPADGCGGCRAVHSKRVGVEADSEAEVLAVWHHRLQCSAHEVTVAGFPPTIGASTAPNL